MLEFCECYRRIAICRLFLSGTPGGFSEYLCHGDRAFLFYLQGHDDESKATAKAEPFFEPASRSAAPCSLARTRR